MEIKKIYYSRAKNEYNCKKFVATLQNVLIHDKLTSLFARFAGEKRRKNEMQILPG